MRLIRQPIDVLVVSPGGVGSTFLLEFLGRFVRTNDPADRDKLKHSPTPPFSCGRRMKIVYLFGDPMVATVSLFRRGFHAVHSGKMQRGVWKDGPAIGWGESLQGYAASGRDGFRFERHWENYAERFLAHPTLFVRYEKIWEHVPEVLEFAGVDACHAGEFPERISRAAGLEDLDRDVVEGLEKIHGRWRDRVARFPDIELRHPGAGFAPALRCAGNVAAFFAARSFRGWRSRKRLLPSRYDGSFAVDAPAGEGSDVLREIGERAGGEYLESAIGSSSDAECMFAKFARRRITIGDEVLSARNVKDPEALADYVRERFSVCRDVGALPVLCAEGGCDFFSWFES